MTISLKLLHGCYKQINNYMTTYYIYLFSTTQLFNTLIFYISLRSLKFRSLFLLYHKIFRGIDMIGLCVVVDVLVGNLIPINIYVHLNIGG